MELIDWRELYAANRAVIEGRGPATTLEGSHPRRSGADLAALARPAPPAPARRRRAAPARRARCPCRAFRAVDGAATGGARHVVEHDDGRARGPSASTRRRGLDPATPAPARRRCSTGAPRPPRRSPRARCSTTGGPPRLRRRLPRAVARGQPAGLLELVHRRAPVARRRRARVHRRRDAGGHGRGAAMDDRPAARVRRRDVGRRRDGSVLAATHPDVFSAVAVHSGLAYGSARNLPSAMQAMRQGGPDPEGRAARRSPRWAGRRAPVPALVVHGSADQVVCPVNGEHAVRQWLATNRLAGGDAADVARPDAVVRDDAAGRLPLTRRTWTTTPGMSWCGARRGRGPGTRVVGRRAGGSYTDPRGPSASPRSGTSSRASAPDDRLVHGRPPRVPVREPHDGVAGPERGEHPGDARAQRALVSIDQSDDLHGWTVGAIARLRTKSHPSVGRGSTCGRPRRADR